MLLVTESASQTTIGFILKGIERFIPLYWSYKSLFIVSTSKELKDYTGHLDVVKIAISFILKGIESPITLSLTNSSYSL